MLAFTYGVGFVGAEEDGGRGHEVNVLRVGFRGKEGDRVERKSGDDRKNNGKRHIPPDLVVEPVTAHRNPPEVRIWRLSNQSRVGTVPPSTSTPHWPACWARR